MFLFSELKHCFDIFIVYVEHINFNTLVSKAVKKREIFDISNSVVMNKASIFLILATMNTVASLEHIVPSKLLVAKASCLRQKYPRLLRVQTKCHTSI